MKVVSLELKDDLEQALDKEVNAENQADDHDEKVLRGTAKEVLEELSKGNAVLVHCAQGKYVNTNINRHKGFIIPKVSKKFSKK